MIGEEELLAYTLPLKKELVFLPRRKICCDKVCHKLNLELFRGTIFLICTFLMIMTFLFRLICHW
jgi:hypothetical protein